MNREDLYALVWQTPLSRLAKRFGLSDVGLRKICRRHDIPTPPLGYWAKRMHGKPVNQPPLPPSKTGAGIVPLVVRPDPDLPPAIRLAQDIALSRNSQFHTIVVPAERPKKLHRVATATGRILRMSKADHEGFKTCKVHFGGACMRSRIVKHTDLQRKSSSAKPSTRSSGGVGPACTRRGPLRSIDPGIISRPGGWR